MVVPIVSSSTFVTLLGAGSARFEQIRRALKVAPILVAADGGADHALAFGQVPDAVIGDLDSLSDAARAAVPGDRLHRIAEQESTDFDKALRSLECPLVIGVGFIEGRMDHALACFQTLLHRSAHRCVLLGAQDVVCLVPPEITLDLPTGTRVSLFALSPVVVHGEGLEWPLDGTELAPDGRGGTSNRSTGGPVRITASGPGLLLLLPEAEFEPLIAALDAAPGTWDDAGTGVSGPAGLRGTEN